MGDGNFHIAYLIDPAQRRSARPPRRLNDQLVHRALAMEGTCTGEHGIGLHKQGFLVDEAGSGAVEMMRTLKRALDPKNILNPGRSSSALSGPRSADRVRRRRHRPARVLAAAVDAVEVHAEAPQPRHVFEHLCAVSCSGRSLCWEVAQRQ